MREERLVALLPEQHLLARRPDVAIGDLAAEPVIIPAKRARPYAYDLVMAYFAAAGLVPNILQETTEKPAMLAMVAAGMGVALVPDWVRSLSRAGVCFRGIRDVSLSPTPAGAVVGMSWRPQQRHAVRDDFLGILRGAAREFHSSDAVNLSITPIAAAVESR